MQASFDYLAKVLSDRSRVVSFDFETTGLNPLKSRAFMVSFAWDEVGENKTATWFFGDNPAADLEIMRILCTCPRTILAHNAKFEMAFLSVQFGLEVDVPIWDTMVMARVQYNDHMSYSLENCGKRIDAPKIDIKAYMDKHGMSSGKAPKKNYHFDQVPREIITDYCENDALVSLLLYKDQVATFRGWDAAGPAITPVIRLELATTKNLFAMERRGLLLNQSLCHEAFLYEQTRSLEAAAWLTRYLSKPFIDSAKELRDPLVAEGIQPGYTEKGGESFDSEALSKSDSTLARQVLIHRDSSKRATTYFGNFIELLSPDGRIHPSIFQVGAASARFSVRDPSCQNWPDDWGGIAWATSYPVRRVFMAEPGCVIASLDYAAMELRVMADEADEMQLIRDIQSGTDFHQKLADSAGVTRGVAKCIAKGSLVLTDSGPVPIEQITLNHRVWDGVEFVTHEGILSRGVQEVITYDGVTGTKDHRVFTQCGRIVPLEGARAQELKITVTGIAGQALRLLPGVWGHMDKYAPTLQQSKFMHAQSFMAYHACTARTKRRGNPESAQGSLRGIAPIFEEVFDIINAGPRRRFTVNGRLVKNSGRFAKLYGAGFRRVAKTLSITEESARRVCSELDNQCPNIAMYSRRLIRYAEANGWGTNWLGRRYFFDPRYAYKYPNYRIQGGCSEVLRFAIDTVTKYVTACAKGNTYVMLPIHDELVLNVDKCDLDMLPSIRRLMIEAYKGQRHLAMDVACSVGDNFADVEAYSLESTTTRPGKTL